MSSIETKTFGAAQLTEEELVQFQERAMQTVASRNHAQDELEQRLVELEDALGMLVRTILPMSGNAEFCYKQRGEYEHFQEPYHLSFQPFDIVEVNFRKVYARTRHELGPNKTYVFDINNVELSAPQESNS